MHGSGKPPRSDCNHYLYQMRPSILTLILILACGIAHAQKRKLEERLLFSLGMGMSELKRSFGPSPNEWTTRFSYRFGIGYRFSDRLAIGLDGSVFVLRRSNAVYFPTKSGITIVSPETKGERFVTAGLYVRAAPFKGLDRLSLQSDVGIASYALIGRSEYSGNGLKLGLTASYDLLREETVGLEPFFSVCGSALKDKTINGELIAGRNFIAYTVGVQLQFRK
jgi:hypothetical protein